MFVDMRGSNPVSSAYEADVLPVAPGDLIFTLGKIYPRVTRAIIYLTAW